MAKKKKPTKKKQPSKASQPTLRDECLTLMTPNFYKDFKCIGAECENNCCHHWNVTMDKPTYDRLSSLGDIEIKQVMNLHTEICDELSKDYRQFILDDDGNCPCLDDKGWCNIHKNHGEEVLPQICKIFPRDDKLIGGVLSTSLSISCPEAARKILLDPAAMSINQQTITAQMDLPGFVNKMNIRDAPLHEHFRQLAYQCVVGSETDSLEQRLFKLAILFDVSSERIDKGGNLENLLFTLERSMLTGELDQLYHDTQVSEHIQQFVLQQLLYEQGFSISNAVFTHYKQQAIDKIKASEVYNAETTTADLNDFYNRFSHTGYQQLIDTHGHAFINLLLHWIYGRAFNLQDGQVLYSQFANLALKFFYVRMLCGMLCQADDKANDALLVGVIHSISRSSDHDKYLIAQIYEKLHREGLSQQQHILGLIKV